MGAERLSAPGDLGLPASRRVNRSRGTSVLAGKISRPFVRDLWPPAGAGIGGIEGRPVVGVPEGFVTESSLIERIGMGEICSWIRPDSHEVVARRLAAMVEAAQQPRGRYAPHPASAMRATTDPQPHMTVVSLGVDVSADEFRSIGSITSNDSIVIAYAMDGGRPDPALPHIPADRLSVTADAARRVAGELKACLAATTVDRLVAVAQGRQPLVDGVLRASLQLDRESCRNAIERSTNANEVIARIVAELIAASDAGRVDSLILSARLGYAHASLGALVGALERPDRDPWWEQLEGDWYRVHPIWRKALLAVPIPRSPSFSTRLARLVGQLESEGLILEAIDVCASVTPDLLAERMIDELAGTTYDFGEDGAFAHWLAAQPPPTVARIPRLKRINAELFPQRTRTLNRTHDGSAMAAKALSRGRLQEAELWAQYQLRSGNEVHDGEQLRRTRRLLRMIRRASRTAKLPLRVQRYLALTETDLEAQRGESRQDDQGQRHQSGGKPLVTVLTGGAPGKKADQPPPSPAVAVQSRNQAARADGAAVIDVSLLGPLRVVVNGRAVARWSGDLGRSIFAFIVSRAPQPVGRDVLLATFWPDVPPRAARNRLHVALHALRRDLMDLTKDPIITFRNGAYSVGARLHIRRDIDQLERILESTHSASPGIALSDLETASTLFRGDYCEDCRYDEWAVVERERHHRNRLDVVERLGHCYLTLGNYAACIDVSRRLLALESCHEAGHRLLMRAHARLDQHHLAIRQFDACRRELAAEFGMEPSRTTTQLHDRIRRRDPV